MQMATSAVLWGAGDILAQRVAEGRSWQNVEVRRAGLTSLFGLSFMGPVGASQALVVLRPCIDHSTFGGFKTAAYCP